MISSFSFKSIFNNTIKFFLKNFSSVFVVGILFFAFIAVFILGMQLLSLEAFDIVAAFPEKAEFYAALTIPVLFGFLPLFFVGVLLFCIASLFLPACRDGEFKLKNIIPRFLPLMRYTGIILLPLYFLITLFIASVFYVFSGVLSSSSMMFYYLMLLLFTGLSIAFIFLIIKFSFVPLRIIEGVRVALSIKESFEMTKEKVFDIFIIFICLIALNLTAVFTVLIGSIITVPFTVIFSIYTYLEISEKDNTERFAKQYGKDGN